MAKKAVNSQRTYRQLKQDLEEIIERLQHEGTDIDEALELHKKAQHILKQLESYIEASAKKAEKD